ncbi:probable beta-hexosaminidase fdl [Achroia grisella]|uniref:probable beta-hexosaminidase fdl n=1 Tax=Achroia grisella TaxID=688607 RepID=UPI0027D25E80|nr:probable beta-hexosaminidase fdl [Achroia grisella]
MSCDETSCSDCRLEIIERRWTQVLLKWINKCVTPKNIVKELNKKTLVDIINKYKQDVNINDTDRAMLCCGDLETFIMVKYPILRLRFISEETELSKKMYILTSVLLYHCCANSQLGLVGDDICLTLDKTHQNLILRFCEKLSDMEITVNNINLAIRYSCSQAMESEEKTDQSDITDNVMIPEFNTVTPTEEDSVPNVELNEIDSSKEIRPQIKFKPSVTYMPSFITDTSSCIEAPDSGYDLPYETSQTDDAVDDVAVYSIDNVKRVAAIDKRNGGKQFDDSQEDSSEIRRRCRADCTCTRCSSTGPCCGDPGSSMKQCEEPLKTNNLQSCNLPPKDNLGNVTHLFRQVHFNWRIYLVLVIVMMLTILIMILTSVPLHKPEQNKHLSAKRLIEDASIILPNTAWQCKDNFCQKIYKPISGTIYASFSRCILLCTGPQLWPHPIGYTYFSKKIVALATNKLEYKFQSIPSENVHHYLAEAFKLFLGDLARLERIDVKINRTNDFTAKKMYIQIDVESDPDPRLLLNTDESYAMKIETIHDEVIIKIAGASFCGVRHGLETLSQLILLDQSTGYLITLSNIIIKDAPTHKYRGLMVDTARNYIPVPDLMRTIDAMAMVKLNTLHWRISDVTSFPLIIQKLPLLVEYGAYDRKLVYTKEDVRSVVIRAGIRGIRVLMEVAAPGPVGRPWSWSDDVTCPRKNENFTCDNILCLRLEMNKAVFDMLEIIYAEIIEMTKVDDIFHLSDGLFSLSNCYYLIGDREGFLEKALERLKLANKGFLPKLPVIWYTTHLMKDFVAKTWDRLGVQLSQWQSHPTDNFLSRFKVIHSSRWDLSCEMRKQRCHKYRTWQDMYQWKSWKNIDVFTIEGGEAILWTDLVDTGNLDYHLWPRVSAVAERLWSDIVINNTATGHVYVRLDSHRWRMLLRGVKVQPIWPVWCSLNPSSCIGKLK